jgi:NTP pyrophosphatase (non-canonical NTP hydrolase)
MKNWIMCSIAFMLIATTAGTLHGEINPFGFPKNKSPFAQNKFLETIDPKKQTANQQAKRAPLIGSENPLEQELFMLGSELQSIADELVKALGSKEVKQEIDKKIANASKKPGLGSRSRGTATSYGGYRPGTYGGGRSFGGNSSSKPFGGASFGSKPFGSFGGGGYGGGSGFGGYGGNRRSPSSPSSLGSSGYDTFNRGPRFSGNFKDSSPLSNNSPVANSSKDTVFRDSAKKKSDNSPEAILQTKVVKQYTEYVDRLENKFGEIAKEANSTIRASKLNNINLSELNKLFANVQEASSGIEEKEFKAIQANENWQKAANKLKKIQSTIAPLLIELMTPLPGISSSKVANDARETFNQLELGTKIGPGDLKAMAFKRAKAITSYFNQKATEIAKKRKSEERKPLKKKLGDELQKIITTFPIDLVGAPMPPELKRLAEFLSKE